ncbi:MAG: glycosyltransferase [Gammaproteobacteria bacterium]|nr:glycosyltransferase [Gammaproteobacteria bacterium]
MFRRRGIGRFLNFFAAIVVVYPMIRRTAWRGYRVVLFVRNDPVLLLAARVLRRYVDRLVFQSSFPHEEVAGASLKGRVARLLYRMSAGGVDGLLAVSPLGLTRLERLFPGAERGEYIPLLADALNTPPVTEYTRERNAASPVRFIYAGTHSPARQLETVVAAAVGAYGSGACARFTFVGGSQAEIERLRSVDGAEALEAEGVLVFQPSVSRPEVRKWLADADVGLSVVPPLQENREMSPTKLAEYLGAGLAVLASRGIPLQEQFIKDSGAGMLVDFSVPALQEAMLSMSRMTADELEALRQKAYDYATGHLVYSEYLPRFRQLIDQVCGNGDCSETLRQNPPADAVPKTDDP